MNFCLFVETNRSVGQVSRGDLLDEHDEGVRLQLVPLPEVEMGEKRVKSDGEDLLTLPADGRRLRRRRKRKRVFDLLPSTHVQPLVVEIAVRVDRRRREVVPVGEQI